MTRKLLERLAARGDLRGRWHITLYFKRHIPDNLPELDPEVFTTYAFGSPSFSFYYYVLLPLRLWRDRPQAVYYPNYMLPLLHPPAVRSVVMLTEDIYREMRNPRLPFRYRLAYRMFATWWAARRASRILAISASSRDALLGEGIPMRRIAMNTLATDDPIPSPAPERSDILFVGQAFERRHLRETLAAFGVLAQENSSLTMRVVGADKYEPPLIESAVRSLNASLGRTAARWDPHLPDAALAAVYAGARIVAYVSDTEAFGLPPLEALSYGAIPVVREAPVHREVLGDSAVYARDGSVDAIADALRRGLGDEGARAHQHAAGVLRRYRWDAHADRFLALMTTLCRATPS